MSKRCIVVFDDGETWMCVEGVQLAEVSASQFKKIDGGEYPKALRGKIAYNLLDLLRRLERADACLQDPGMASGEMILDDERAYREQYTTPFMLPDTAEKWSKKDG